MDVPVWRGKSLRNSPRSGYQSRPSPELHSGGYRKDVREPRATQFRTTTALAAPCSSVCPSPYTNPKVKTFSGKDVFDFRHGLLEAQGATGCQLGRFRLYNFSYSDTASAGSVTDPATSSGSAPEVTSDHVLVTFDETVPLRPTIILRPDSATAGGWTATGAGSNNSINDAQSATSTHYIYLN